MHCISWLLDMICLLHFLVWKRSAKCLWSHSQVPRTVSVPVWTSQAEPEKHTKWGNLTSFILFFFSPLRLTVLLHSFNWNSLLARMGGLSSLFRSDGMVLSVSTLLHSGLKLFLLLWFTKVGYFSWSLTGWILLVGCFHCGNYFCLVEDGN